MVDLLGQGAAWLAAQLRSHAAVTVAYRRGVDSVDVPATIGSTEFEQIDGNGILQKLESRDFLIATADLVLGGGQTLPVAGDRIRETAGGTVLVYEVMAPGDEPPWRYSDRQRLRLRIHTKHVDTEGGP